MGKYESLAGYLKSRTDDSWNATFAEVEQKLGFPLPRSAREHRAWWSNQKNGNHSQTAGWQDAGWQTRDVDLRRGLVLFERTGKAGEGRAREAEGPSLSKSDLLQKAAQITGITDGEKLMEAALAALIRQETARYFAQIGGTMPDASAAPRERPFG